MKSYQIAKILLCSAFAVACGGSALGVSIAFTNGDFESGNTGFTSAYEYTSSGGGLSTGGEGGGAGKYGVGTSASFFHPAFTTTGDHTTGSGNMMVVNGSGVAGKNVWTGTLDSVLQIDCQYQFSVWVMNVYDTNPANLQFSFGGNVLGNFSATGLGTWQNWTSPTFTVTANQTASAVDLVLASGGNDFALDDISVIKVGCPPVPDGGTTLALLGLSLSGLAYFRRKLA